MSVTTQFTVTAPRYEVQQAMLDLARTAQCLPGVELEANRKDGTVRGRLRLGSGAVYQGVAFVQDHDEDDHTMSIVVRARESGGRGMAALTLTGRLSEVDQTTTRVNIDARVALTGTQPGSDILQQGASEITTAFAAEFRQLLLDRGPSSTSPKAEDTAPSQPTRVPVTALRLAAAGAAACALALVLALTRRRSAADRHRPRLLRPGRTR